MIMQRRVRFPSRRFIVEKERKTGRVMTFSNNSIHITKECFDKGDNSFVDDLSSLRLITLIGRW